MSLESLLRDSTLNSSSSHISLEKSDLIEIAKEIFIRSRRMFFIITVVTFAIGFLPAGMFDSHYSERGYIPSIYLFLSMIMDHSVSTMLFNQDIQIVISSPLSVISVCIELALMISFILNLPLVLLELYRFIEPGMYSNEKKLLKEAMGVLLGLFAVGAAIAYFIVVPVTLRVLTTTTIPLLDFGTTPMIALFTLDSIFNLVFWTVIWTGLLYTLPEIIYILVLFNLIEVNYLESKKKNVFLAILILAAIITPDPTLVSMLILSLPLMLIYQIIIQRGYNSKGIKRYKYIKRLSYGT